MKTYFLLLIALLLSTFLSATPNTIIFREAAAKGDTTQTLKLVLQEKPDYPVLYKKTNLEERWLIQLYKDGGDGVISPLDDQGKPTGDDMIVNHPSHLQSSQGLYFAISYIWTMNGITFYEPGQTEDAWQGDKVYLRIFNNTSIEEANKYIVSHSLFTVPPTNTVVMYIPDFGWDEKGWINFRKQKD